MTGPHPRGDGRIVVGVTGSLASLAALRYATALARRDGTPLLAVLVWEPPEGEGLFARMPDRAWARLWGDDARRRLEDALVDGLGGVPAGLAFEGRVVRGAPAAALCAAADRPGDLLVLGSAPGRGRLARPRRRPVLRGVLRRASGPVLTVPGPALFPGEARVLRRHARVRAPDGRTGAGVRDGRAAGPGPAGGAGPSPGRA
ncbi:universal stress protein [Streptomyces sp. NPDC096079]|uniref:universal stress protein n=1 Tax=unclassified Streptomyces TaxID=2593676 RepID=UPI0033177491